MKWQEGEVDSQGIPDITVTSNTVELQAESIK